MTLTDGRTFTGVISEGVAVFTFSSINLSTYGIGVQGSRPFALLSQGDITLRNYGVDANALGQTPGAGGGLSAGQGADGYPAGSGGGGFGGAGGNGGAFVSTASIPPQPIHIPGGAGGASYGGLTAPIQGGSGGGTGYGEAGAGGGAIELGANGTLTLSGSTMIMANGSQASGYAAGGGSGGSISLLGNSVDIGSSVLSVLGGGGSPGVSYGGAGGADIGGGGGGGGGRIDILTNQLVSSGDYDLSGGTGGALGSLSGGDGESGIVEIGSLPEPPSWLMGVIGIVVGAGYAGLRQFRE